MASLSLLRPCFLHNPIPKPSSITLKPPTPFPSSFSPLAAPSKHKRQNVVVVKSHMSSSPQAAERIISIAAYTLPFFNSIQYGHFIFSQYPKFALLFDPIIPFLSFYRSIPYASFIAFFALYLGIARNPSFNQFLRFNAMQAITLDVLLIFPVLFERIFSPSRSGFGFKVLVWSHTAIFVFSLVCFVYSAVSCVLGRIPYLPFVADAASRQI